MYNWVTTRKIARTEGPNYPARAAQTVDAVVAKWIPVTAALLACAVTPARAKMDVRAYDWAPAFTWVQPIVDATVRTYIPAATTELQSYRVAARPALDVRRYEWQPEFISIPRLIDPTIAKWAPAFATELASSVPPARPSLDVRRYEWTSEESAWIAGILTTPPTVAQTWPAFQQSALSGRTPDRPRLDVRRYEWTTEETSWIVATQTAAPTVAQTAPAWTNQAQNFRTASRPALDLFRAQSIPDIFGVPDDWITWAPLQDTGGRTRDRARLDVRAYEWGQPAWITTAIPVPITDAQKWPAILQASGLSYRTASRALLDVRQYEWSQPAWIFTSLPVQATVAQTWPAMLEGSGLSYRTAARPSLDVRSYEWAPAFSWVQPVVDAAIARLVPVFRAELAGFRTADDPRLDVRAFAWAPDAGGWILASFAPPATAAQIVPPILQNLGTEYRTVARAPLDVRRYDWQPAFTWVSRVVDATVAKWAPIFRAQESPRTPARPDAPLSRHRLDVPAPVYEYLGLVPFPDLFLTTTVTSRMPARTVVSRLSRYTVRLTREDDV